jgi:two-component system, NarL family, sensor histidine kinase UhpB
VTLRSRLFLLVAGTLSPMAVATVAAAMLLLGHEREMVERDAMGRARAAMSAVDAHLRGSIAALETLAASKTLPAGDIPAFHAESQQVLRTQPAWVNIGLATAGKVQLSNAVYNLGKPEPFTTSVDEESFDAVLRTGRPAVGSVAAGTVVQRPTARVRVPVVVGGEVRYVMSAPLNLPPLNALLQAQSMPDGWFIGLVDREHRVIVRLPPVPTGVPASDSLREATERAADGWFLGRTLEGRQTYTAYVTSALSGWVLGVGIPASEVEAEARIMLSMLAGGLAVSLAAGLLLAWLIARRSAAPA